MLSNPGIDVDELSKRWVTHAVGSRPNIVVAMDWTDFDADNQATIMLSLVTRHGRSTPLLWLTVDKATLKNHRNAYEYRVLVQLAEALPANVKVLIVADRGFGDQKLYQVLTEELKFDYLIRFRGNIAVTSAEGETRPAADWVGVGGRARTLRNAFVTADGYRASDEQPAALGDPAARRQLLEQCFVEPPRRAVIDVLDGGLAVSQPSRPQSDLEAPGVAVADFAVEQQCQPFGMGEIAGLFLRFEFDESLRHAVELERSELVKRGMCQHQSSSPQWK